MILKPQNSFFNFSDREDLLAIIKTQESISYQDLFSQANQIAFLLSDKGIEKGTYVPLLVEDQLKFIKITIAVWLLGAIPVPLNTKLLSEEIYSIIDNYNFKFLINDLNIHFDSSNLSGKKTEARINHKDTKTQSITKIELSDSSSHTNNKTNFSIPNLEDEAVVIFTSGTSGRPKGVVHTFSSLINSIENGNQILMHQENDRWLASLPFYHIGGFQILCRSLYYGCTIVLPESLKTEDLVTAITNLNPTHISLVSAQLQKFCYLGQKAKKSLKVTLVGGGFIDDELMFEAEKLGWKPYRVYGSSETASMITGISASDIKAKPQSVGKALNNVEIKISDDSEILIKSNSLFKKYLDDEKETSSKLINSFYHTGDLGLIDDDGYLFIEARRNDLIVTGGENVNPIEVEKAILKIDGISEVCVFPKPSKTWGQIISCVLVTVDKSLNGEMIKEKLKISLAGFKIPKEFIFTSKLPRTSLGKLEREKIRKMF
jgi:o-succinylbenzoate---CoA ligase